MRGSLEPTKYYIYTNGVNKMKNPHEVIQKIEKLINTCVLCLAEYPDEVEIETKIATKSIITYIKVNQKDCGKIIGKRGRTIDCIYHLAAVVKNIYLSDDVRSYKVEVIESDNSFNWKKQKNGEGD